MNESRHINRQIGSDLRTNEPNKKFNPTHVNYHLQRNQDIKTKKEEDETSECKQQP